MAVCKRTETYEYVCRGTSRFSCGKTEDVARKDQIFLYDNLGESASKKKKSPNTAAQNSNSVNTTAISSDYVAKIATLKERYNNRTSKKQEV